MSLNNYDDAMEWYQKSAELDNGNAMNSIGYMYQIGLGVNQDFQEAIKWYKMSAARGNLEAKKNLSNIDQNKT